MKRYLSNTPLLSEKMIVKKDRVIAGIGMMIGGFLISLTVIGLIIGIPLLIIGLLVMGSGIRFGVSEENQNKRSSNDENVHSKISHLKKLYEEKSITKKEFEESKKKLLNKL